MLDRRRQLSAAPPNKALELPGFRLPNGGSILAACVGSRRSTVSGRQLNADPLDGAIMQGERNKLYEAADAFFDQRGNAVMYLAPAAAVDVCLRAAHRGMVVARVEGGIWHTPGFEARLDCIWDGADPPLETRAAEQNNERAAEFIQSSSGVHTAFVITTAPLTGWPHNSL